MKNGATTKVLRLQVLALTLIQREFDEVKTARDEHRRGHNHPIGREMQAEARTAKTPSYQVSGFKTQVFCEYL